MSVKEEYYNGSHDSCCEVAEKYIKELENKIEELELKCKDEYTRGHKDGYEYCLDETDEDYE